MSQIIVQIPGIAGEETLAGYEEQISCTSLKHGIDMPVVASATDRTEGASVHGTIDLEHEVDKASALLRDACARGLNLGTVVITKIKVVGGSAQAADITTLGNARLAYVYLETPVNASNGQPEDMPIEMFGLDYSEIKWEHKSYVNGVATDTISGSYDTSSLSPNVSI